MKRLIEAVADAVLGWGPLPWLGRFLNRHKLVVLAYHGVEDRESFVRHLEHLSRHFKVVSLDTVLNVLNGGSLPDRSALITFDDGERTILTDAHPELSSREMPSVLFAIAKFIDTNDPFWWFEAEELFALGARSVLVDKVEDDASLLREMKQASDETRVAVLGQLRASADGSITQGTSDELRFLDQNGMSVENPLVEPSSTRQVHR